MKYQLYILLVFCGLHVPFMAQVVPGYQGHKTVVSYQVSAFPAISKPTYFNRISNSAATAYPEAQASMLIPLNISHKLSIERVLGRKFAMSLNYSFSASKDYVSFFQTTRDNITGQSILIYFDRVEMNYYANYFTGSFIFYGQRALAPFGKYFKLNIGLASLSSSYAKPTLSSPPGDPQQPYTVYTFNTKDLHYGLTSMAFGCSFGSNRIYFNRLVLNKGINFQVITKGASYTEDSKNINKSMHRRMNYHDMISYYLSVGYLF